MQEKVELMYRQPGAEKHQNITEVLDEVILTLRDLSQRVTAIENNYQDED
jgi:hypothetical protein